MRILSISRLTLTGVLALSFALGMRVPAAHAAARTILVHFTNNSDSSLTLSGKTHLDGGCWSSGSPPPTIAVGQHVDIASESCGVLTGTEFELGYTLDLNGATMAMHYNNPYAGSNSFDEVTPQGYSFARSGGDGNEAELTVGFGCNSNTCDGIPDDWKVNGVTIDPGGGNPPQYIDLPNMGVSLDRPNILVQLDWMQDSTHNQQLRQAAIDTVIRAFDQSPVTYRGATRSGITLIVDAGPNSTITPGGAIWGPLSRAQQIPWSKDLLTTTKDAQGNTQYDETNFYTLLKSNFVPTGRLPIFHYGVVAAEIASGDSTSGLTPGNALGFMTTLGNWTGGTGSQSEQTGTFMHEFGHVLGLPHGGQDGTNFKPNYPSVMNYGFQTAGIPRGGALVFDYSRDTEPNVDETTLTEAGGISLGSNPSGYGTGWICPDGHASHFVIQQTLAPADFNCNGTTDAGTGYDANGDGSSGTLSGATSDWSRINFKTGGVGAGAGAKDTVPIPNSGMSTVAESNELTLTQARQIRILPLNSTLTYTGATSGDYHDPATVSATLVDPGDGNSAIQGRTIAFQLGSSAADACSATTDSTGTASCSISPTQAAGAYTVTASFAGDSIYRASSDSSQTFTIKTEETSLALTGPTVILAGSSGATLTAKLVEDGANDSDGDGGSPSPNPAGQTVTFTIDGQSCQGQTDAGGAVGCTLPSVSGSSLGSKTLAASFTGDAHYAGSSASGNVIVFAFPSRGAFVLGDQTVAAAAPTTVMRWWSDSWWNVNTLSGGTAPLAFKGFAAGIATLPTTSPANVCGSSFVSSGGNSPPPANGIPSYMGVLVASSIIKPNSTIKGTWSKIVVVKTDPGYATSPGHPGTGTIVATFCG